MLGGRIAPLGDGSTHDHSVVPSEDGKFIEAGNKIPSSSDVASYKNAQSQDGEGVHRIALPATDTAFRGGAEVGVMRGGCWTLCWRISVGDRRTSCLASRRRSRNTSSGEFHVARSN